MSDLSDNDSDEMYSITSSKTIYKRSLPRSSSASTRESEYRSLPKIHVSSDSTERYESEVYFPVTKWAVDYNNKNYIRSQCNKNTGLHRRLRGRPNDWQIEYDNSYFTRSKINPLKGLHRRIPEVKRKYVPDNDDLADATGWEFDCGPEFDQIEQDVPYIPEGRIITRGCYRWYGVKRNDSDCDIKQKEHRENVLTKQLEKELRCGHEFLQSDVPHMSEQLEKKYTRGAYRHYETQRNTYDLKPEDIASASHDPEWKRKHHSNGFRYLDLGMCKYDLGDYQYTPSKGKPFRRTILNKVHELRKVDDSRESSSSRRGTRIHLRPGEGEKTVYEGVPDRFPFKTKKTPSIRSVFKKKSERQRYESSKERGEFQEYEREESERSYREELEPEYEERMHRMAERQRGRHRSSYEEEDIDSDLTKSGRERFQEYAYRVKSENRDPPRRHSMDTPKRRFTEDRDNVGAWSDNVINTKREQMRRKHSVKSETRTESYRDEDYSPRDIVVEKRRNKTNDFDYDDSRSQSKSSRSARDFDYVDHHSRSSKGSGRSIRHNEADFEDIGSESNEASKKLPPHVEERMKKIRQKMHRKFKDIDYKQKEQGDSHVFNINEREDDIDLMKHRGHPKDRGHSHDSEYEKYVTKNGSEIWIKNEEKYAELHHKD